MTAPVDRRNPDSPTINLEWLNVIVVKFLYKLAQLLLYAVRTPQSTNVIPSDSISIWLNNILPYSTLVTTELFEEQTVDWYVVLFVMDTVRFTCSIELATFVISKPCRKPSNTGVLRVLLSSTHSGYTYSGVYRAKSLWKLMHLSSPFPPYKSESTI